MGRKISVVINTVNEEKNVERAIRSVKWADEIIVCDLYSTDKTVEVAKRLGAKVVSHTNPGFVEPVRNFAISKATGDWILVLDPDEEIPSDLASKLQELADSEDFDFVEIPRRNLIFGKWMKASMWWPDYNIRFFKKGSVAWSDKIHQKPNVEGEGLMLSEEENLALVHHHYESPSQFIERMNRYTDVQAKELKQSGYIFEWKDLLVRPLDEFLGRFFASRGFEDGLHGLSLSLLQAFSFLVMYLKVWEIEKFREEKIDLSDLKNLSKKSGSEIEYWFKYGNLSKNPVKKVFQKIINKFS